MTEYFLRLPDVLEATGLKRTSLFRLISKGQFPKQIKIGPRASAWSDSDVKRWMDDRKAGKPLESKAQ